MRCEIEEEELRWIALYEHILGEEAVRGRLRIRKTRFIFSLSLLFRV